MKSRRTSRYGIMVCAWAALAAWPAFAQGQVLDGNSSSAGLWVNLTYGEDSISIGPTPITSGSAPAPYTNIDVATDVSLSDSVVDFSADLLRTTAASDVDGLAGSKTTTASVYMEGYALSIGDILSFSGTTWEQTSGASGAPGSFDAGNTFVLTGTSLTILDQPYIVSAGTIYDSGGLVVTAMGGSSSVLSDSAQAVGNGLSILFLNFEFRGQTINGTAFLGMTQGTMRAVPEPATLLSLGVPALVFAMRRRKR